MLSNAKGLAATGASIPAQGVRVSDSQAEQKECGLLHRLRRREPTAKAPTFLLIGPYDPHCGEYTFLAPPLGVWRLAGVLESAGHEVKVFDPNCCEGPVEPALEEVLRERKWDVVGISTTFMTLPFDLSLAYLARRSAPEALLIAGGMEATFNSQRVLELGPFDLVVLGEGEIPLLEIGERLAASEPLTGVQGTAHLHGDGEFARFAQRAMTREELRDAIFSTPYERMPYGAYWDRLARSYAVGELPTKAEGERTSERTAIGARGSACGDSFGSPHHLELLPHGMHLLLFHELPPFGPGGHGAPGKVERRRMPRDVAAHPVRPPGRADLDLPG